MKLIVGLGNPGKAYAGSRHNIGFMAVDALAKDCGVRLKRAFISRSLAARAELAGSDVLLAEPLTYMNLSGASVAALARKNKVNRKDILVICDDLDLEFGRLKIRSGGSSGGHRGLDSIIGSLGSNEFSRLRVGIGRPDENADAAEYVLSAFSRDEKKNITEIIDRACACAKAWAVEGVDRAMNLFNQRS